MQPSCTQRITRPPFRAPHHTASPVSLIGGGPRLRPGEISLAHKGVLFLDELPEFPRHVIETLRQPLEDRYVTISRAVGTAVFPADISLVAAMNPCPCGYRGHRSLNCHCSESSVRRYMRRISGPMLDRIDLCVEVPAVDVAELIDHPERKDSCEITSRIQQARNRQTLRFGQQADHLNALIPTAHTSKWCRLPPGGRDLLIRAAARHRISARAVDRLIRVARTVADLRDAESIEVDDLAFALSCRTDLVDLA